MILLVLSVFSAAGLAGCVTPGPIGGDVAGGFGYGVGYAIGSAARNLFSRTPSIPGIESVRPPWDGGTDRVVHHPVQVPAYPRTVAVGSPPVQVESGVKASVSPAEKTPSAIPAPSPLKAQAERADDCPLENVW